MQIGKHVINVDAIESAHIEHYNTATQLHVHLKSGRHIAVTHHPMGFDPINVYDLERTIRGHLSAKGK